MTRAIHGARTGAKAKSALVAACLAVGMGLMPAASAQPGSIAALAYDAQALTSGGYWHHQQRQQPHPAVNDTRFQDQLLADLVRATGTKLA